MKKLLILAALAAFVACTKENQNQDPTDPVQENFSKAEVILEVLNSSETGAVDPTFFDYVTFDVQYKEFAENNDPDHDKEFVHPENFKKATINASKTSLIITGTKKTDAKKSYCADIIVTPVFAESLPATITVDFALICKGVIYDAGGKKLITTVAEKSAEKGVYTETQFKNIFKNIFTYPDWVRSRLAYGYTQNYFTKEWMYNFGVYPLTLDL